MEHGEIQKETAAMKLHRPTLQMLKSFLDCVLNQFEIATDRTTNPALRDVRPCLRQAQAHFREYLLDTEGED
jgi:hypothetical protein